MGVQDTTYYGIKSDYHLTLKLYKTSKVLPLSQSFGWKKIIP